MPQPDKKGPPSHPLIVPMTSFSLLSAFLSYNTAGATSLHIIYSSCTGLLGIWGLWAVSGFLKHQVSRTVTLIFGDMKDHIRRSNGGFQKSWCRQAHECFHFRQQVFCVRTEKTMETRAAEERIIIDLRDILIAVVVRWVHVYVQYNMCIRGDVQPRYDATILRRHIASPWEH